jgi:hypothetical protein
MIISDKLLENVTREVLNDFLNEARPRNVGDKIIINKGRKATRLTTRIRQIQQKVKKYGLMKRRYNNINTALSDYNKIITSFGCELKIGKGHYVEQPTTENGASNGVEYNIQIIFGGDLITGTITLIGYGTKENPLEEFETHFSLVEKAFTSVEN